MTNPAVRPPGSSTHHPCCAPAKADPSPRRARPGVVRLKTAPGAVGARSRDHAIDLRGGVFTMGTDDAEANPGDGEGPPHAVTVGHFAIAATTVTNEQFASFANHTGYCTVAEDCGWSYVYRGFISPQAQQSVLGQPAGAPWWAGVAWADWRRPEGPGSSSQNRPQHPVVHISHLDATAYCRWLGARLPTEVEWEYAARGGLAGARYPWGDRLQPAGTRQHMCNIWQGTFPRLNTAEDGWVGTCPVRTFAPNGFGLYNMVGNVWEWTSGAWVIAPDKADDRFAMRGGSYMCHDSYCNRYRVAARTANTADSSAGNIGFRIVFDRDPL